MAGKIYLRYLILTLLMTISVGALAQGFDENYEVLQGDFNGDGFDDLYVRQKPQVVLIHGDVITPIFIPPHVKEFVLLQGANAQFEMQSEFTSLDMSSAGSSSVRIELGDFNADGIMDLLTVGIGEVISGAFDQIIFANELPSTPPFHLASVDQNLIGFFDDLAEWSDSPEYFEENAPLVRRQIGTKTEFELRYGTPDVCNLYLCSQEAIGWAYCPSGGLCSPISECLHYYCTSDGFGGVAYQYTVAIEVPVYGMVPDYSVFNQDAIDLVRILVGGGSTDKNINIQPGSIEALAVKAKLEEFFGVDVNEEKIGEESEFGENLIFDRVGVHEFNVFLTDVDNGHTYLFDLDGNLITTSNREHERYLGKQIFANAAMGIIARSLSRFIPRIFSKRPMPKGRLRILTGKYS